MWFILILIGIVVLAGNTFGDFSALASVSNKISSLENERDSISATVEKSFGGSVIAVLGPKQARMHGGFLKYFYFLSTLSVPNLWINRVGINLENIQTSITGETLDASSLQLYYTKLKDRGPFKGINLRISEYSNVKELTTKDKAKMRQLAAKGKRAELVLQTTATSRFEISNEPPKKKKKR